jgi:uncharacterized delta-60 repeat protein
MDIRFTLQAEYSGPSYAVSAFNLFGYTGSSITPIQLATNITKAQLLTGYTVTTPLEIVRGYVDPLGTCSTSPDQNYSLVFSQGPIIVGTFSNYSGSSSVGIVKLTNNLSLDRTFNVGSGFNFGSVFPTDAGVPGPMSIVKQSNGKIVVVGTVTSYDGVAIRSIIRLNPDGSKDYTFSGASSFPYPILSVDTQSDGKIILGGYTNIVTNITTGSGYVMRLNVNGSIDTSFATSGTFLVNGTVKIVLVQPNDQQSILVAGNFINPSGIIKLTANGAIDNNFASSNVPLFQRTTDGLGSITCMQLDNNNRIMIGYTGNTSFTGAGVLNPVRVSAAGVLDTSWYPQCNAPVTSMLDQPGQGGKVILAGKFTAVGATPSKPGIARVLTTGLNDGTWSTTASYRTNEPTNEWFPSNKISALSDGNILFMGPILSVNGSTTITNIAVLSPSGTNATGINGGAADAATYRDVVCIQ